METKELIDLEVLLIKYRDTYEDSEVDFLLNKVHRAFENKLDD